MKSSKLDIHWVVIPAQAGIQMINNFPLRWDISGCLLRRVFIGLDTGLRRYDVVIVNG
jgi:hypothetical protein